MMQLRREGVAPPFSDAELLGLAIRLGRCYYSNVPTRRQRIELSHAPSPGRVGFAVQRNMGRGFVIREAIDDE